MDSLVIELFTGGSKLVIVVAYYSLNYPSF